MTFYAVERHRNGWWAEVLLHFPFLGLSAEMAWHCNIRTICRPRRRKQPRRGRRCHIGPTSAIQFYHVVPLGGTRSIASLMSWGRRGSRSSLVKYQMLPGQPRV